MCLEMQSAQNVWEQPVDVNISEADLVPVQIVHRVSEPEDSGLGDGLLDIIVEVNKEEAIDS